jgi:Tol biopolymer transport system component
MVVPAVGGVERRLAGLSNVHYHGFDWSPDGATQAFVDKASEDDLGSIFLFNIPTEWRERLTMPPSGGMGDRSPVFSPDGTKLAFVRWREGPRNEIHLVDLDSGETKRLATHDAVIRDLDWLPDGSALVFSSDTVFPSGEPRARRGLWAVPVSGGKPSPYDFAENARGISVAGNRLVYSRSVADSNIWRVDGPSSTGESPPSRLIYSDEQDWEAQYSPDGTRIAFASDRSAEWNIWLSDSEGTDCSQLTPDGIAATAPRWSPDGKRIAFTAHHGANLDAYVITLATGAVLRLTEAESVDGAWSWSRDGQWIYLISDRSGDYQVWKVPAEGGAAERVTHYGGMFPVESEDGRTVYYQRETSPPSIWRLSLDTGEERLVLERELTQSGFILWEDKLIYFLQHYDEGTRVESFDPATGNTARIATLGKEVHLGRYQRLNISPDGRWMIFTREDGGGSDIMLVEGFY